MCVSTSRGAFVSLATVSRHEVNGSEIAHFFLRVGLKFFHVFLCLFKECSKKTKTDDQENASVDVPSPAQENGEASRFFSFVSAHSKRLLVFSCLGAHVTVHVIAPREKAREEWAKLGPGSGPDVSVSQVQARGCQGKRAKEQSFHNTAGHLH